MIFLSLEKIGIYKIKAGFPKLFDYLAGIPQGETNQAE